jgi:hypothetical protein
VQPLKASLSIIVTLLGIVIEFSLVQRLKADLPISVTLSGIVIDVKLVQPLKAPSPISVTLLGIVIEVRLVQPLKAYRYIPVTLSGIVMLVSPEQPEKAELPMLVTPFSITTDLIDARMEAHGSPERPSQSSIAPVPLIVSTPFVKSQVTFSPHSPLSANIVPTLTTSARQNRVSFLIMLKIYWLILS